jgi:hypothetical protein
MPPEVQGFLAGITLADVLTWGGVVGAIFAAFKWVIPFARKVSHFIDDVAGEPARAGVPARPGLMERFATVETKQDEQAKALEVVRHEVTTNHGSSLKDAVKVLGESVEELHGSVNDVQTTLNAQGAWQAKHEEKSDALVGRITALEKRNHEGSV